MSDNAEGNLGSEDGLNALWASVQEYVEIVDQACLDMLPKYAVLWANNSLTESEWQTIYELSAACVISSQSLLHLVLRKQLRDAEIISRSILEGTLRFLYILFDKDKAHERLEEFTESLFLFAQIKNHVRVEKLFRDIPTMSDTMRTPLKGLLLPDTEVDEARSRYTKQARKSMEERWSASSIVTDLIHGKIAGHEYLPLLLRICTEQPCCSR